MMSSTLHLWTYIWDNQLEHPINFGYMDLEPVSEIWTGDRELGITSI